MAGAAYRQLIDDLYRNNRLIKNELQIGGKTVDLGRLRANLLTVIAERDHITPPCQSESILDKVSSADEGDFPGPGRAHWDYGGRPHRPNNYLAAYRLMAGSQICGGD